MVLCFLRRSFDRHYRKACIVIRLSRAGRERAIIDAIRKLETGKRDTCFTKGEICKAMGIKSTSRIRDILRDMSERGVLVCVSLEVNGYHHTQQLFGVVYMQQTPLPTDHEIIINGVSCRMYEQAVSYA